MTTRTCSESLDMPRRWSVEVGPRISEAILPAKLFPDSLPTHGSETSVNSDRNRRQENLKGSACLERLVARTEVHAIRGGAYHHRPEHKWLLADHGRDTDRRSGAARTSKVPNAPKNQSRVAESREHAAKARARGLSRNIALILWKAVPASLFTLE